jgi:hypothetical protein
MLEVKNLDQNEKLKVAEYLLQVLAGQIGAKAGVDLELIRKHASDGELYIDIEKAIKIEMLERTRGCGYLITETYDLKSVRNAIVFGKREFDPIEACLDKYVLYVVPYSTLPPFPTYASVTIYRRSTDPLIPSGYWRIEYDGGWRKSFMEEDG